MQVDYDKNTIFLDKRIFLLEEVTTLNSYGSPETKLVPIKSVFASIEPVSGKEYFIAEQVNSEATVKIITRYDPCIKDSMTIIQYKNNKVVRYEMKSPPINIHDGNNLVILMCVEYTKYKGVL